ncbi:MAG: TetR/AcrR family transcriptional regulator [Planctomycetota bacterium]
MAPAGRPKLFDETEALEAAQAVFWEKGFEGASMTELVNAMKIGRQSLYDTFGDKRRLYLRALGHYAEQSIKPTLDGLSGACEGGGTAIQRLRRVLGAWETLQSGSACKGCMLANTLASFDRRDPDVAELVDGLQVRLAEAFEQVIREAQAAGDLDADVDAGDLAALLTAVGHGLAIAGRSRSNAVMVPAAARALAGLLRHHEDR